MCAVMMNMLTDIVMLLVLLWRGPMCLLLFAVLSNHSIAKSCGPRTPRKHRPQTVCGLCFGVFSRPHIFATAMVGESRTQD